MERSMGVAACESQRQQNDQAFDPRGPHKCTKRVWSRLSQDRTLHSTDPSYKKVRSPFVSQSW
jgi:hypothetical protein